MTNSTVMTCDYEFTFASTDDIIPMFHIKLYDHKANRNAVVVLMITDAFKILHAWYKNDPATVFRGGYENLCSICWYDDNPIDNMAISAGDANQRTTFWLGWDNTTQLIESLQKYIYYCTKELGGH